MAKRKAISNKLRFEVFKRDCFKCQYCGKSAPDVTLNVDHIDPVVNGGTNDILNLITSCFECNNGKSGKLISDNSILAKQKQQLDELQERREQLQMLIDWKTELADKSFEMDKIVSFFNKTCNTNITLTDFGKNGLKQLLAKYSVEQILDGIISASQRYASLEPGEIWNKLGGTLNYINSDDSDKMKMRIYGAIKKKFSGTYYYKQYEIINTNRCLREIFKMIDQGLLTTYEAVLDWVNEATDYRQFSEEIERLYDSISN